ncbi:MAG: SDR family NAD(P)-dependent oxidoreductase [Akkermansiaceae bacterium]|nr:SDR family NAD(P)-dependent oxidoreductase [Akkermansiaceae bacterium]
MKTALVTGASSGIGKAIATALLDQGMTVIGLCRSVDQLPDGVKPLACDLRNESAIKAAFETLEELDILVNSAGLAYLSRICDGNPSDWDEMWRVNVHALGLCSQLSLALFPEGGGHILNLSSMSGHRVPPTGGFYASTKFAVRAISEALRAELKNSGNKTRISCLSPGFVDTPLLDKYFAGREDQLAETRANIDMLTPEAIADAALHILTSPASVEINDVLLRSADQAI